MDQCMTVLFKYDKIGTKIIPNYCLECLFADVPGVLSLENDGNKGSLMFQIVHFGHSVLVLSNLWIPLDAGGKWNLWIYSIV